MYSIFNDFLDAALNACPATMKLEAIKAYNKTSLFSPERRQFAEVLIQTAEALNEIRLDARMTGNTPPPLSDPQSLALKSAYCLQSAFILSRTSRTQNQHKRTLTNFESTLKDLKALQTQGPTPSLIPIKHDLLQTLQR